ncbi:MAG: TRAP transporter fused permease subunit [Azospirillum sp.]|nr:TRAP transporter fused permease subunit [Azospirillum sp.]
MLEQSAETGKRAGLFVLACALVSVVYHLYLIFSGLVPALVARPLHFALAIPFVFLIGVQGSALYRIWSAALGVTGIAACLYIAVNRRDLVDQFGRIEGPLQFVLAVFLILLALEMARRAVKWVMPTVAAIVLLYGLFGQHIPGEWGHAGLPPEFFFGTLLLTEGGLWSSLTATSVELVAPFLILGAFVAAGQAGTGFMALATQVAGRYRAGTAKVEVVASALYGTISGSASANVVSTGTFTIPAMIRAGYPPSLAAAVEAVASTGGQIMPPVMGAGVFLMAALLQTPYADLMLIAILPSILFFVACWIGVDLYAVRHGLKGIPASEMPGWAMVGRNIPFFLGPLGVLIAVLGFTEFTPQMAAFAAVLVALALLLFEDGYRVSVLGFLRRVAAGSVAAAEQVATIAAVILCASLITGVFHMTGVGVKITSLIVGLSGGELWIALVLTAIACIALGMELPTTAAYVICIAVAGPALIQMGLPPLHAHMFVFWYALLCTITPPVCGNVFIASTIAKTPWLPVAFRAMRIGLGLFVVPLGFVANPSLLGALTDPWLAVAATVKIGIGIWFLSFAFIAATPLWKRAGAFALGAAIVFAYGF